MFSYQAMFKSNRGTVSGYFLAGRFMTWLPVSQSTPPISSHILVVFPTKLIKPPSKLLRLRFIWSGMWKFYVTV